MALLEHVTRPNLPYDGEELPNNNRYQSLLDKPPSASMVDADLNKAFDSINYAIDGINNVTAGNIPGTDNIYNKNHLLSTDGEGNLSWVLANTANVVEKGMTSYSLGDGSVRTEKIENTAVTEAKLGTESVSNRALDKNSVSAIKMQENSVTSDKIENNAVVADKIAAQAVVTDKIAAQAVVTDKIADNAVVTDKVMDGAITKSKLSTAAHAWLVPTGCILPFGGTTPPDGFLLCDGAVYVREHYAELFAIVGTSFGAGDGTTTFNVPNMAGKVPAGYVNGSGDITIADKSAIGGKGGNVSHTLTEQESSPHAHAYAKQNKMGIRGTLGVYSNLQWTTESTETTSSIGGGQPHNNVQPFVFFNYIIKT